MLDSKKVQRIQRLYKQGMSFQTIAYEVSTSKNTVRLYVQVPDRRIECKKRLLRRSKLDCFPGDFIEDTVKKAGGNFEVVAQVLRDTARKSIPDFDVDASTVRRFVYSRYPHLRKSALCEVRSFQVEPGQQLQLDFVQGDFTFTGHDRPTHLYIFEAVYAYSRMAYIRVCPDMKQVSWCVLLLDCMQSNGVPGEVLCDKDRSMVASRKGKTVDFNRGFTALCDVLGIIPRTGFPHSRRRNEIQKGIAKEQCLFEL